MSPERKKPLAVVIFRHNLRILDNPPLHGASRSGLPVIGLYLQPPQGTDSYGFERTGPYRKSFLKQSVASLEHALKPYGIVLHQTADADEYFKELSRRFELQLHFMREAGTEEAALERGFERYTHTAYEGQTLLDPFAFDPFKSFSSFRKQAEKQSVPRPLGAPQMCESVPLPKPQERPTAPGDTVIDPGIDAAHERLESYMPYIHSYKATRGGFEGENLSTRLSPYLSAGSLSARSIYWRIKAEEELQGRSSSSEWIIFELLWRDFFHLAMRQLGARLFIRGGIFDRSLAFYDDTEALESFLGARTGVDIIDAAVTELWQTGWSSNRSRQLLAGYFVKNLGLDWRIGAAWFESLLIDYNPACNYGNWAYQAHVGHDSIYRIFDPEQQSQRYGGNSLVNRWLGRDERPSKVDYRQMAERVRTELFSEPRAGDQPSLARHSSINPS